MSDERIEEAQAEQWAHELIAAFEREPAPRPHVVVNVTVARWALSLAAALREAQAENERLRDALGAVEMFSFDVNADAVADLLAVKEIARAALAPADEAKP